MNPLNLTEPLAGKVHTTKPHDVTPITSLNEPYEPFLWLGRVCGVDRDTYSYYPPPLPCANKVHKVHRLIESARLHAVLSLEPLVDMVHRGFRGFREVTP